MLWCVVEVEVEVEVGTFSWLINDLRLTDPKEMGSSNFSMMCLSEAGSSFWLWVRVQNSTSEELQSGGRRGGGPD